MKGSRLRVFADTTVLIAAAVSAHPRHDRAINALASNECVVSAHGLLEAYAGLTTLPVRPRITVADAAAVIESFRERADVVVLSSAEYARVVADCAQLGLMGGVVYDALHAAAARKARAQRLLTFNTSDFLRVWPEGRDIIAEP